MSNLYKLPRIVVGGTSSGCGKTTVTCAILGLLVSKKMAVGAFKCGPDYIDPMFHSKILGVPTGNLDIFFGTPQQLHQQLANASAQCQIAVIEGVMGYYDGWSIGSVQGSTYHIAATTQTPAILAINCKGKSTSVLAEIKGYTELYPDNTIAGVVLNNITHSTYTTLKSSIEQTFGNRVQVLGYLPKLPPELILESRHLGLVTANEITDIREKMFQLASFASQTLDIENIIALANTAPNFCCVKTENIPHTTMGRPRIAIAYDQAFCFYYKENLKMLEQLGAELVYFSPLKDCHLPTNIQGLYLGGGYPELYTSQLSSNITLKSQLKAAIQDGLPTLAECGGYMYLCTSIDGYEMVNIISSQCNNTKKLSRFGYITLQSKNDNLLCSKGEFIKGHEYHYYDGTFCGQDFTAKKINGTTWDCVIANDTLYAGYPHLSFCSNPTAAERFVNKCKERTCNHD